jgi:DNA-binding LacI/PurR family transcriptional regulator
MANYKHIAGLLENRIRHGDYFLKEVPTQRELADEMSASPMTVRKAFSHLMKKGLLVRQTNKRLTVNQKDRQTKKQLRIALLVNAYPDPYQEQWQLWLSRMAEEKGFFFRAIGYCHWDDTVIMDTLEGFDGVFLLPISDEMPEHLIEQIRRVGKPLVIFGRDMTHVGIPTLRLTTPEMVRRLLDHVGSLGHRQIHCLNTQPVDEVIRHRIEQWQLWMAAHGQAGRLINEPVKSYSSAIQQSYQTVKKVLTAGESLATAIFCITSEAAVGAMRAIQDYGLKVGKDISVCAAEDDAGRGPYLPISLTSLKDRDPKPYLSVCVEWMLRGGTDWIGPLLVQPADAIVFAGESTGACPEEGE